MKGEEKSPLGLYLAVGEMMLLPPLAPEEVWD